MSDYRDETRLEHMLAAVRRILKMSAGLTRERLVSEEEKTMAITYAFVVLGEAANNISKGYAADHPEIDWAGIAGFRHKLVHDYDEVNYDVMWRILSADLPALLPTLERLAAALPPPPPPPKNLMSFL